MQLTQKSSSIIALCLGVPFTSVGAIMTLWIAPGALGQTILVCCQIWLLCLTVIWLLKIEPKPLDFSLPTQNDWITGIAIGLLMFGAIFVVYWLLLEPMLDVNSIRDKLTRIIDIDRQAFIFG
ncbi:MAG: CPBP family intramembrane glutamate endopeptidase, partial [Cyanobacteria bacterium P01_G01_bin.19]